MKAGFFRVLNIVVHTKLAKPPGAFEKIEKEAKELLVLSEKYDVKVRSVHLPFGEESIKFSPLSLVDEEREQTLEYTKKIIKMLAPCKPEIVVIHGSLGVHPDDREKRLNFFVDYLKNLCDFCDNLI